MGLNQLGECEQALASLEAALEHMPRSLDAMVERAIALFELCRFKEAQAAFERVLKDAPEEAVGAPLSGADGGAARGHEGGAEAIRRRRRR